MISGSMIVDTYYFNIQVDMILLAAEWLVRAPDRIPMPRAYSM